MTIDAETLGGMLKERHLTIACAESCTGGLLTSLLTDVPGSSAYVRGAIVCYTNEVKERVVGVPSEIIDRYTEISRECARAMAAGVRRVLGADIGVGITGNAGPEPSAGQPVGLVYIAAAVGDAVDVARMEFVGSRYQIKTLAAAKAMELVADRLRQAGQSI